MIELTADQLDDWLRDLSEADFRGLELAMGADRVRRQRAAHARSIDLQARSILLVQEHALDEQLGIKLVGTRKLGTLDEHRARIKEKRERLSAKEAE